MNQLVSRADAAPALARADAVSVSCQQHASVWLRVGSAAALSHAVSSDTPPVTLSDALRGCFVFPSPIWMDSSTGVQCAELEAAVGGPTALAEIPGSRAYE